ncbi:hypothetical protein DFP76_10750 [Marinomonas aquiplantarum]|uniref:Uncharacterized protein n=1 Tax=Marinomonas aquiplantarum TaxID=491951 RepID=A0A366CVP3_9GAMM|nr:hypothetical protein DFP76_10750 [Marinomonas aquiplantarum]
MSGRDPQDNPVEYMLNDQATRRDSALWKAADATQVAVRAQTTKVAETVIGGVVAFGSGVRRGGAGSMMEASKGDREE